MKPFLALLAVATLIGCSHTPNTSEPQTLTFSNTQRLSPTIRTFMSDYTPVYQVPSDALESIEPPPANDALVTRQELAEILTRQASRTQAEEALINAQLPFCKFEMPHYRIGMNPKLDDLILTAYLDINYYFYGLKDKFDRVRPSFLDESIQPSIKVPLHGAYPSGHSATSMLTALILAEIYPEHQAALFEYADSVGVNRIIAGVHYRSDHTAGQALARIYFEQLQEQFSFADNMEDFRQASTGKALRSFECEILLSTKIQSNRNIHDEM